MKRLSDEIAVVHARMTLTAQTSMGEVTTPRRSNVMPFVVHQTPAGLCASTASTRATADARAGTSATQRSYASVMARGALECLSFFISAVA